MSKVLFIRSNPISPDPRVDKEAVSLSKNGNKVEILAWDRLCAFKNFEDRGYYKIKRVKIRASYGKPSFIPILFIWFLYEFLYLIKGDYDFLHACDLDTLIPAVIVSKIRRKTLIYDCFDFYGDRLPRKVPNLLRSFITNLEIYFSEFADLVIIADKSRKKQFKNKLKNVIIINNSPMEKRYILEDNLDYQLNEFVIFYGGIINNNRGINNIIEAIKGLSNVKLVIAGYEVGKDKVIEKFKDNKQVTFLGKISYDEILAKTWKYDMLFALYDPKIRNNRYASPNKLFEAFMCGKPIIVNENTRMAEIVTKEKAGLVVPYNNIKVIKDAIIKLKNDPELRKTLGENGRKAYDEKYSWNVMEKRLTRAYQELKLKK